MGYFSQILAEPAAQQAGRMSLDELLKANVAGAQIFDPLAKQLGIANWQFSGGANDAGDVFGLGVADLSQLEALKDYTFDWSSTGPANTGTLTVFDPTGKQVGAFNQQDQSTGSALAEWAGLVAAGFGGLGLAGFGPLGSLGQSLGMGAVDAGAGSALPEFGTVGGAGSAAPAGSGLSAAGSTYGTIASAPGVAGATAGSFAPILGQGGAALATGAGLTAPAFAGGAGLVGGLGMTAGAGATAAGSGLSGLLGSIGGYLPAVQSLASLASGAYGLKLAGDARQASDPFAPYRAAYGQKLAALEANPGSIVTRPGFQAGLETIGRKSAASGYYGSGNMASALSRYSGDFYTQEANRLAGLAGAGQTPGAGQIAAADLAGQSLGSIGYGIGPLLQRLAGG